MKTLTLKNPTALGERDPKYGQAYWSYTHDSDTPVMFNLMDGEVGDGSVITAETIEVKESKNGNEYHRLKKVTIESQSEITPHRKTDSEVILAKLDEILAILKADTAVAKKVSEKSGYEQAKETRKNFTADEVVEDIGDEPINLADIPF